MATLGCRIGTFGVVTRASSSASMAAMAGDHRRALGRRGEDLAATHLQRHGWHIVERNFRTREGEIDLIAARRGTLAFCEVKTLIARRAPPAGGPTRWSRSARPSASRVRRMARAWLADRREDDRNHGIVMCGWMSSGCCWPPTVRCCGSTTSRVPSEPLQAQDRAELRRVPRRWVRRAYWRVVAATHRAMELRYGIRTEGDVDLEDLGVAGSTAWATRARIGSACAVP